MVTKSKRRFVHGRLGCVVLALLGMVAQAQGLPHPTGPVILTISGQITQRNSPDGAQFDLAMLSALPNMAFSTRTQWQSTPARFSGPSLKTVLEAVGARGNTLQLRALDRFESLVPVSDLALYNPIIALFVNGQALKVRTLGPALLMYPFDQYPELNTDVYYSRCVWQLQRIVVQ
jgi:hypothetical protein